MNVSETVAYEGAWLRLKNVVYRGPDGKDHVWETLERTTTRRAEVDGLQTPSLPFRLSLSLSEHTCVADVMCCGTAVEIVALLARRETAERQLVLLRQYRPPVGRYVVELPAGLLERGEGAGTTAVRELQEETGYAGACREAGACAVHFSAAVSNTSSKVAVVAVDGDDPRNAAPHAHREDTELVTDVFAVPLSSLRAFLQRLSLLPSRPLFLDVDVCATLHRKGRHGRCD